MTEREEAVCRRRFPAAGAQRPAARPAPARKKKHLLVRSGRRFAVIMLAVLGGLLVVKGLVELLG